MEEGGFLAVADRVTVTPVLAKPSMLTKAPSLAGIERIYRRAHTKRARERVQVIAFDGTTLEIGDSVLAFHG